jgi:hypothetical protein
MPVLLHTATRFGIATAWLISDLQCIRLALEIDLGQGLDSVACSFELCNILARFLRQFHNPGRYRSYYFVTANNIDLSGWARAFPLELILAGGELLSGSLHRLANGKGTLIYARSGKHAGCGQKQQNEKHDLNAQGLHIYSFFPGWRELFVGGPAFCSSRFNAEVLHFA